MPTVITSPGCASCASVQRLADELAVARAEIAVLLTAEAAVRAHRDVAAQIVRRA